MSIISMAHWSLEQRRAYDRVVFSAATDAKATNAVNVVQVKDAQVRWKPAKDVPKNKNGAFQPEDGWCVEMVVQLSKPATVELRFNNGYSELVHL